MKKLLVLALPLIMVLAGLPLDRARFVELNKQGRELAQKQDWKGLRSILIEIGKELPGLTPTYALRMASVEARLGNNTEALKWMQRYAAMGLTYDVSQDDDLKPLAQQSGWAAVAAEMKLHAKRLMHAETVCALPLADLMPEDLTFIPGSSQIIVSSVRRHTLYRVSLPKVLGKECTVEEFPLHDQVPAWPALAVAYDPARKLLWMTASAMPGFSGVPKEDSGKAALLALDAATGKLLRRFDLDSGKPGVLGDMSIASDGTAYVTDSMGGNVYRVQGELSQAKLERIASGLFSPQTPVLSRDGKRLFVAEYALGIAVVDLATGNISYLEHPDNIATTGLDGMYLSGASLIGIQNGTEPERILRFRLNPGQTRIESAEVVAQGPPIGEPTHAIAVNGWIYVTANVGWNKLDDAGNLKSGQTFTPPLLLRFREQMRQNTR